MEPTVSPAECALAIAVPLTEQRFLADAAAPDKDFARSVIAGSGRSPADAWSELYRPKVVVVCERVAARLDAHNARVATDVTAPVLRELLARYPLVTLVAHARSSPIRPDDVLEPRAILEIIREGGSIVARHLRDALADRRWAADAAALRDQVAAALDAALEPTRAWTATPVRSDRAGRPARLLSRGMLEDCLGRWLRRAPVLELCDGGVTMDELLAAIPQEFAGVLDLSVCNSFAFGESIKRRRPDCTIIENVFLARAELRLALYALVIDRLAREPARYSDALTEISLALIGGKR